MKNSTLKFTKALGLLALGSWLLALGSCKEYPSFSNVCIRTVVTDTTYIESPIPAPEEKNVLLEEFTGVRCPNCPAGHTIIAGIKATYPTRFVSVGSHPINSLGTPYAGNADLQTQIAQTLFDYLGQIGFEPAGGVDRVLFTGQTTILMDRAQWPPAVDAQMTQTTPVNIDLESTYDAVTATATITVTLHYTSAVTEPNKLTILLTESDLVRWQLNGTVVDENYIHKDVLRAAVTDVLGDPITTTTEAGRVVKKIFTATIPPDWAAANMDVVAYVHEYGSTNTTKKVYQVKETELE